MKSADEALSEAGRDASKVLHAGAGGGVAIQKAMAALGISITNKVKKAMHHSGRGTNPPGSGKRHRPSAPGEPPASDTGYLANSYAWRTGLDADGPFLEVGSNAVYAPTLEFGSQNMAPRPAYRPAVEASLAEIGLAMARGIEAAQREAASRLPREIEFG